MKNSLIKTAICLSLFISIGFNMKAQGKYILAQNNPFALVNLSNFASPALGDIDNDGDLDLFVGQYNSNTMLFFRNIGTAKMPIYEMQSGQLNPMNIYSSNSGCNAPALVDIDHDGDLDAFVGIYTYLIRHLKNVGNANEPDFIWPSPMDHPLDKVMTEGICSFPAFVDIDNDMDDDVFISDGNGSILFYRNIGNKTSPNFDLDTMNNPFINVNLTARTKIAFHDINGDGLIDAVISHDATIPELLYFENTGSITNASFEQMTGTSNPFDGITGPVALVPAFADIDGDGDKDLVLGTNQRIRLYEAVSSSGTNSYDKYANCKIYPNPSNGLLTVTNLPFGSTLKVVDITGKVHYNAITKSEDEIIDTSTFMNGVYSIRIENNGTLYNEKLLVSK
ncbi:MAG: T9SS type A sorting domain-containing protein [Saprospiraceae bacterium]|nr:T9SS type A sorting domain-containing protein [Saprospiraceae bacterium]MBK9272747.1 T9SS type A sorting domain-containing protein [Saprospiraceae bacterium]